MEEKYKNSKPDNKIKSVLSQLGQSNLNEKSYSIDSFPNKLIQIS